MLTNTTETETNLTISQAQAQYYQMLCNAKNMGDITMTKAYKEATKPFKTNVGTEEKGFEGSLVQFITLCKQNGWIAESTDNNTGNEPSVVEQELNALKQKISSKTNNNTFKILLATAVVVGIILVIKNQNKN